MNHIMLSENLGYISSSKSDPLLHTGVSSECLTQNPPPVVIRVLALIMTGLYFLESVGTTFILWLWPSLAPESRLHQYISSMPGGHHYHHHEHRRHSHISNSAISNANNVNSPRRRSSRLRSSSNQNCDYFLDQPDSPKFAAQRKEILAIFEQHNDEDGAERTPL